jgi:hypothetical protein
MTRTQTLEALQDIRTEGFIDVSTPESNWLYYSANRLIRRLLGCDDTQEGIDQHHTARERYLRGDL